MGLFDAAYFAQYTSPAHGTCWMSRQPSGCMLLPCRTPCSRAGRHAPHAPHEVDKVDGYTEGRGYFPKVRGGWRRPLHH